MDMERALRDRYGLTPEQFLASPPDWAQTWDLLQAIADYEDRFGLASLWNLEDRGVMFVGAGEKTYQGMIIGENSRSDDLDVNPIKGKQLTNVRAAGKDEAVRLTPPRRPSLEQAIAYIEEDELVEVTPKAIRLRKRLLDPHARKRAERQAEAS